MYIDYVVATFVVNVIAKLLDVDAFRSTFHHDSDDILDDWHCSPDNDEREDVCAERVSVPS